MSIWFFIFKKAEKAVEFSVKIMQRPNSKHCLLNKEGGLNK